MYIQLTGEKFKEALHTIRTNGMNGQQSSRNNKTRSTMRKSNKANYPNSNSIELKRVKTLQEQHMTLEIEYE